MTDEDQTRKDDQLAVTKPVIGVDLIEPFVKAFFTGLEKDDRIDRTVLAKAAQEPEDYDNVVWWMVAMLGREDRSVWAENAKPHLQGLINTWGWRSCIYTF